MKKNASNAIKLVKDAKEKKIMNAYHVNTGIFFNKTSVYLHVMNAFMLWIKYAKNAMIRV